MQERQVDVSERVARVKRKTRPWRSIIALVLAIASAVISHLASPNRNPDLLFSAPDWAYRTVWVCTALLFLIFGSMATVGVAIGGGALAVYGIRLMGLGLLPSDNIGPLVAVVACGICLGFLPFNFNPARIFMGDAGAHFLGLLMAASTMVIGGRVPTAVPISGVTYFFFAPLFIPILILGVPLVDMAFAFVRRTARGTGFDTPDKEHIHHRLLRLGHGPRRSVIILWAWTAVLSSFLLFPLFVHQVNAFIPIGAAALGVGLYTFFHPGLRRGNGEDEDEQRDQGFSPRPEQAERVSEVVRFPS